MESSVINRHEIRVIGMSRSGNHAIIGWLVAQLLSAEPKARICYLNCCEPKWNPYWTARPCDRGHAHRATYEDFNIEAEKGCYFSRKDLLLFNYEDNFLRNACSQAYEDHHDEWVGPSARRTDVLILRDPFNLFASRWRSLNHAVPDAIAVKMWKQHAKQFVHRPTMLRHHPVLIVYNRWCHEEDYRRRLSERLGIPFSDAGRERVAAVHGGSSFDGLSYDGKASAMRTDDRWKAFQDDSRYRALFDEQVLSLSNAIFGELPMARVLANRRGAALAQAG